MNTSNNNLLEFLKEKAAKLKEEFSKHLQVVIPLLVVIAALIVFIIAMAAHSSKVAREQAEALAQAEAAAGDTADTGLVSVPDVPLEEDAYPDVNELIKKYYDAMAEGDIDTVKEINNDIDDTETIRITETSKYIQDYESIKVYTKAGPSDGTYVAYVYSEVKFNDYDTTVPGMQAYYICTDDNGSLYINDGEESDSVINYIREVSLQDDVVDLNNEAAVAYNDMLAADENLSAFLVDLTDSIDTSVGESLAEAEGGDDADADTETADAEDGNEESVTASDTVVKTVRTTDTVNVRSSDSETADKVGKASEGEEFTLIEAKGNGWSEIDFNGQNAYIKSEYLETATTETKVDVDNGDEDETAADDTETADADDDSDAETSGTVTVKENVRVRASASEDGEKLGTAYMGEKLDVIQKMANGWTKIKYNGKTAYVKSEYVE